MLAQVIRYLSIMLPSRSATSRSVAVSHLFKIKLCKMQIFFPILTGKNKLFDTFIKGQSILIVELIEGFFWAV